MWLGFFLANNCVVFFPPNVMILIQSGLLHFLLSTLELYLPLKCNLSPGEKKQQQFNNLALLPAQKSRAKKVNSSWMKVWRPYTSNTQRKSSKQGLKET